jgi:TolB protein
MTTIEKTQVGRVCKWLLSGVAFAAIVGSSGCATAPQVPPSAAVFTDTDAPAPAVNMFGEVGGVARTVSTPIGDQGFQQHTYVDEGYDSDVTISPNGKFLAFASTRHSEHAGIYTQRVDGTAVTKLTAEDCDNAFPTFSPDGKQIAFCSTRSGAWNIYVMDIEGRNVVSITSGSTQCVHPSYSPDGGQLVYSALGQRTNEWELWTVNLTTGEKRQIGYGLFPNWSPTKNVERIAFQRARMRGSRSFSLWTLDLVEGEARQVTEVAVSSNAAIVSPAWSPDGKRLVFATIVNPAATAAPAVASGATGKPAAAVPHRKSEQDLWTIAADGSDRRRLTDGNGINLSPVWSTDNRVYFISDRNGPECVWSVRPETDNVVTAAVPPAAQPDKQKQTVGSTETQTVEP